MASLSKKLPIVNQTPRQMLVEYTASVIRSWAVKPHISYGMNADTIRVNSFGQVFRVENLAIESALNSVIDGAKPGTFAGAMAEAAEAIDTTVNGWKRFCSDVRRQAVR